MEKAAEDFALGLPPDIDGRALIRTLETLDEDEEIEALRSGMHLLNAQPHPFLKSGEKVVIRRGPLEGMKGIVVRRKNSTRVVLTLELIMKSISVEIDGQDLEVDSHVRRQMDICPL